MVNTQTSINKITSPSISGTFPRTRLFHCMDKALARPVAWIQGPAGSGKSTLVASYLESRNLPHIWYHLDEGDADCATLFYYLGLAAKRAAPADPTPLPLLTKEYQQGLLVFTRRYFENLFGRLPSPAIIVFDDYHEVGTGSRFHEVIQQALEEIPQGIKVILISRDGPPATLARLRSRRRIGFISWEDLRLNPEEIEGVIQVHDETGLNGKAAEELLAKTGGWLAGVVFMLERGDTGEIPGQMTTQEAAAVFDYFACEVFDKTDITIQDFLLKTAFMPQFTPQMASRLTANRCGGVDPRRTERPELLYREICRHRTGLPVPPALQGVPGPPGPRPFPGELHRPDQTGLRRDTRGTGPARPGRRTLPVGPGLGRPLPPGPAGRTGPDRTGTDRHARIMDSGGPAGHPRRDPLAALLAGCLPFQRPCPGSAEFIRKLAGIVQNRAGRCRDLSGLVRHRQFVPPHDGELACPGPLGRRAR